MQSSVGFHVCALNFIQCSSIDSPGIDVPLVNPVIKPYYRDGFGSKSIGEPQWRPHPRNALSLTDRLDNTAR